MVILNLFQDLLTKNVLFTYSRDAEMNSAGRPQAFGQPL